MKKMISYIFVGLVFILIVYCITFYFGNYIFDRFSKEGRESFTIAISFVGLFGTFGGAYFGARISGENARSNMYTQLEAQKEENKKNESFNRKRLNVEMKNNMLNDYLLQLNEYDSVLQKIEVEIKSYLLFTQHFGNVYDRCSENEYIHSVEKRLDDFNGIINDHLEIEKQRNRVIICRNIVYEVDSKIPNITMNMLEPVVNIDIKEIKIKLFPTINSYLVKENDIYSGLKEFLDSYKWIDSEKETAIKYIKENLNSLKGY
ncbi:hypothetical protein [Staphylococcus epidermidis]|uniref:hypothetical protein n=1 Tax=Staphylococcus epidermidis TaxID=1282 RepID=UPI00066B7CE9|nr:hypothetical protein [Staphylococcus epidermidis]